MMWASSGDHHSNTTKYAAHGLPASMSIPTQPCPPLYMAGPRVTPSGAVTPWSSGLCHCFDDPQNCLITCFCPCVTFGQIAEIVNKGSISCAATGAIYAILGLVGLPCIYSCLYRSRLRGQYDVEESPAADCLVHFCCEPCALCQEYRELHGRGFDMAIGWEANMDRQKRGVRTTTMAAPPAFGGMTRA
ncbi:hypothetical protein MLD38_028586 [Melastoma candidum]|uniref:Uncharacterized protein n=1 Tax=Melastoma candidum TaxID=119954 RepID=A0ACB9N5S9_9MYRT|nr:hypothetical protein MLD38_028586 [Melastoma candidum]